MVEAGLTSAQSVEIMLLRSNDMRGEQRVNDRRVISGIIDQLKSDERWGDGPRASYRRKKTLPYRVVRSAARGVWNNLFEVVQERPAENFKHADLCKGRAGALLTGRMVDDCGNPMSPRHPQEARALQLLRFSGGDARRLHEAIDVTCFAAHDVVTLVVAVTRKSPPAAATQDSIGDADPIKQVDLRARVRVGSIELAGATQRTDHPGCRSPRLMPIRTRAPTRITSSRTNIATTACNHTNDAARSLVPTVHRDRSAASARRSGATCCGLSRRAWRCT